MDLVWLILKHYWQLFCQFCFYFDGHWNTGRTTEESHKTKVLRKYVSVFTQIGIGMYVPSCPENRVPNYSWMQQRGAQQKKLFLKDKRTVQFRNTPQLFNCQGSYLGTNNWAGCEDLLSLNMFEWSLLFLERSIDHRFFVPKCTGNHWLFQRKSNEMLWPERESLKWATWWMWSLWVLS